MNWFTDINSGKIMMFFAEKKLFKISDTKIFTFVFALNQPNISMYSKRVFLHNMLLKIIKTLSTAKIRSELYKGYFSNL